MLTTEAFDEIRISMCPVDSKVILQQELLVPARSDRLYFQKGKVSQFQYVNEYLPYCAGASIDETTGCYSNDLCQLGYSTVFGASNPWTGAGIDGRHICA